MKLISQWAVTCVGKPQSEALSCLRTQGLLGNRTNDLLKVKFQLPRFLPVTLPTVSTFYHPTLQQILIEVL